MKKRIVSSIMCLAMLLSLLPVTAFATEEDTREATNVATIGNTPYTDLQTAINAAPTDGTATTIKLLANIELNPESSTFKSAANGYTAALRVEGGRNVTLDLNGKTLTNNSSKVSYTISVGAAGTGNGKDTTAPNTASSLTIIDTAGQGKITNGNPTSSTIDVDYWGTLTIGSNTSSENNFSIENNKKDNTMNSTIKVEEGPAKLIVLGGTIDAPTHQDGTAITSGRSVQCLGTAEIKGGTILHEFQVWSVKDYPVGNVTISGGVLNEDVSVRSTGAEAWPLSGMINVTGGEVKGKAAIIAANDTQKGETVAAKITVSGGKVGNVQKDVGTIELTGGTFSNDVHAYLKTGAMMTKSGSNYVVSTTVPNPANVSINAIYFVKNAEDYAKLPNDYLTQYPLDRHEEAYATFPWLVIEGNRGSAPVTYTVYKDGKEITDVEGTGGGANSPQTSPATINGNFYTMWNLKDLNTSGAYDGNYQVKITMGANAQEVATSSTIKYETTKPELTVSAATGTLWEDEDYEQAVSDLQNGVQTTLNGSTFNVTGTSNYITGWSAYADDEANGNFIALDLNVSPSTSEFTVGANCIEVTLSSGSPKTLSSGDTLVWRISDDATNGKSIPVKLTYTAGGTTKTETYTINLANVVTVDAGVEINTTAGTSVATPVAKDVIPATLTTEQQTAVETQLNTAAASVAPTDVSNLVAANSSTLNSEASAKVAGEVTTVEVVVFMAVEPTKVNVNASGEITSMTLDITPMYKLVNTTGGGAGTDIAGTTKELPKTGNVETQVTVNLTGFATDNEPGVYAKHNNSWYPVTCEGTSPVTGTFTTKGFSPFEFVKNTASVTMSYSSGGDTSVAVPGSTTLTPADIGALPTASKNGYTFNGWTWNNKTFKDLTEDLLDEMILAKSKGETITLTASFTKGDTGDNGNNNGSTGGGGSSATVSVPSATNGKVTVSNSNAKKGDTVTVTVTPNTGYVVDTVTVTDSKGNAVEVTKTDDTHYTFVMPDGRVTVKATFKQSEVTPPPATGFTDVAADAYYADAVKWAVDKGITNGLTATTFGPNNSCTRGQMVTFLYRYAESPAATGDTSFTDVTADAFYADAVKWAVAEEITNGTSSATFSPASNCTRGQIVTFMYRQMAE